MKEVSADEAIDILDLMVSQRYPGFSAYDFLASYEEGRASKDFPDSNDLQILAEEIDNCV